MANSAFGTGLSSAGDGFFAAQVALGTGVEAALLGGALGRSGGAGDASTRGRGVRWVSRGAEDCRACGLDGALPVEDVVTEVSVDDLFASLETTPVEAVSDDPDYVLPSLLTMVTFKELFNALASGDRAVAERLAALMGTHLDPEQEFDDPLDHHLGWALKYLVDDTPDTVRRAWIDRLTFYVQAKRPTLMGYPLVMLAILDRDLAAAQAGFAELLKGHRKESRAGKLFGDTTPKEREV